MKLKLSSHSVIFVRIFYKYKFMELNLSERSIALLRSSVIDFTMSPAQRLFWREIVLP